MATITISIDGEIFKVISRRAKKNLLSVKEQVEEIVRQSAIRTKAGVSASLVKVDDKLVEVFSRHRKHKGNKKKRR